MLVVRAIHTFTAEHGDELEFKAGENIEVIEKDEAFGDGWWRGRNIRGEEGLFPATYIEDIKPAETTPVVDTTPTTASSENSVKAPIPIEEVTPQPQHQQETKSIPPPEIISIDAPPTVRHDESESPKGGSTLLDVASVAANGVANVMGKTINEVQQAIENLQKDDTRDTSDNEADDDSLGIGSGTRAKLAEQSKLANEQRDKQRTSMGVTGLVYSDESGDEEDVPISNRGLNGNGSSQIPTMAASAIPLPTSPGFDGGDAPAPLRLSPAPATDLADRLGPALSLPSTPPLDRNATVSEKSPSSWNVDEVVSWAIAKGFDDSICQKFREHEISGDLLLELDANLLKELDIPAFGKRLRIAQAITELRRPGSISSSNNNQLSPRVADSSSNSFRGMSAPPSAMIMSSHTPPLVSTPPLSAHEEQPQWVNTHGRKSSSSQPPMEAIREGAPSFSTAPSSMLPPSTAATSVPASPVTPNSSKRESTSSLGHKKKGSIDNRERLSFFGRNRKPAPPPSPGMDSRSASKQGNKYSMTPASPERNISGPVASAAALKQIGTPDHSGHLKKKGETIGWKTRYFVLKGAHLYYLKSENEDRIKGHIELKGYRVIVDENANPGNYGFRLVGGDKPHFFSSPEQQVVREWMKALMKATIARDYSVAVTSSCNIPTIPLAEAQAMSPRPPSPASRDATQRANRRENTNTLTPHDANILMSLDTSSGQRRRASQQLSPNGRPASQSSTPQNRPPSQTSGTLPNRRMSNNSSIQTQSQTQNRQLGSPRMPLIPNRPSRDFRRPSTNVDRQALLEWVNDHLPPPYPKASSLPDSFTSGEVIFLLVRALSGVEPSPPVPPNAFAREANGEPGVGGLFAMMDILIDAGIDTAGVTPAEVRDGDVQAIARLIESIKSWTESR